MPRTAELNSAMTINEIIARYPQTMSVFNDFGMDTCCGAGASVQDAASRDGLDVDTVMAALSNAIERSA